ncbi:MAG: hypothetical protein GWP59_08305 [Chlamydiales bacterium]|nr:hypothetical protein [Chlamydiales bacterium]NCF71687.1 hypothetical protein [Chlamydiales bacterium]
MSSIPFTSFSSSSSSSTSSSGQQEENNKRIRNTTIEQTSEAAQKRIRTGSVSPSYLDAIGRLQLPPLLAMRYSSSYDDALSRGLDRRTADIHAVAIAVHNKSFQFAKGLEIAIIKCHLKGLEATNYAKNFERLTLVEKKTDHYAISCLKLMLSEGIPEDQAKIITEDYCTLLSSGHPEGFALMYLKSRLLMNFSHQRTLIFTHNYFLKRTEGKGQEYATGYALFKDFNKQANIEEAANRYALVFEEAGGADLSPNYRQAYAKAKTALKMTANKAHVYAAKVEELVNAGRSIDDAYLYAEAQYRYTLNDNQAARFVDIIKQEEAAGKSTYYALTYCRFLLLLGKTETVSREAATKFVDLVDREQKSPVHANAYCVFKYHLSVEGEELLANLVALAESKVSEGFSEAAAVAFSGIILLENRSVEYSEAYVKARFIEGKRVEEARQIAIEQEAPASLPRLQREASITAAFEGDLEEEFRLDINDPLNIILDDTSDEG